jgi:SAM-dependent methyltransferase
MNLSKGVQRHFDEDSSRFDAIYGDRKNAFETFIDTKVRGVVLDRLRLTRVLAPQAGPWSVLDVGCGSGRYGMALVEDGATRVVGLDFAPRMIDIARAASAASPHPDRFEWHVADWLAFETKERFDVVLAMGYFDYISDPTEHVRRLVDHGRVRLLASFPKRWEWRVPVRRARFALSGSFVRFYDRAEVLAIAEAAGLAPSRRFVLDFGRDYLLLADLTDRVA